MALPTAATAMFGPIGEEANEEELLESEIQRDRIKNSIALAANLQALEAMNSNGKDSSASKTVDEEENDGKEAIHFD